MIKKYNGSLIVEITIKVNHWVMETLVNSRARDNILKFYHVVVYYHSPSFVLLNKDLKILKV